MGQKLKILILLCLLLTGCQTPFLLFPGTALKGEVAIAESFQFAADFSLLQLEVDDYSVILRTTVIGESLYIDAAPRRRWGKRLRETSKVRIKLGEKIYPAMVTQVTDPELTSKFLPGRTIYRLDPLPPQQRDH